MTTETRSIESRRRHLASDRLVRLAWLDADGQLKCVPGKCIDISSRRIRMEVPVKIPLHTPVMLRADGIHFAGAASVTCVTSCGDKFILLLDISRVPTTQSESRA
jgi:hypothetical protein